MQKSGDIGVGGAKILGKTEDVVNGWSQVYIVEVVSSIPLSLNSLVAANFRVSHKIKWRANDK